MKPILHISIVLYCLSNFWQVFAINFSTAQWGENLSKFKLGTFSGLDKYTFSKSEGYQTDSLLVIHNDKIIFEKFDNGYKKNQKHRIWSISKSISALLIGIAIEQKLLSLDDLVHQYYPMVNKKYSDKLKLKHLMQMSSGFDWSEGYESNPLNSDVINMLYINQHIDMATYTASRSFKYPPGKTFHYSSGETNLIMGILKKTMNKKKYDNYPWEKLFDPIGIKTATWQRDLSGTFVGSSYLFMSPQDLARVAYLVLHQGMWNNKQIVSKSFIEYLFNLAPSILSTVLKGKDHNDSYGAQWWLNKDIKSKKKKRSFKSAPEDTILGLGHHGQLMIIIPSEDLIIIRYASDKDGRIDIDKMLSLVLKAIK
ncbi:MAG: serine hydrolase [Candidatus Cloacimonadota bacterium]|nr:MAG: serine hydrolase [Candidatus Cloacimonadota bacterium]